MPQNNLQECVEPRQMATLEVVELIERLAAMIPEPLGIGIWEGTITGKLSGNRYEGRHIGVFNEDTLVALFGPENDAESEAAAALFVTVTKNATLLAGFVKNARKGENQDGS